MPIEPYTAQLIAQQSCEHNEASRLLSFAIYPIAFSSLALVPIPQRNPFMDYTTSNEHSPGAFRTESSATLSAALNGNGAITSSLRDRPATLQRSASTLFSDAAGSEEDELHGPVSIYGILDSPLSLS